MHSVGVGLHENGPNIIIIFKASHSEIWKYPVNLSDISSEEGLWIFQLIETHKEYPLECIVCKIYSQLNGIKGMLSSTKMGSQALN